jgi:uncharacterized protein (DUF2336 family)/cellulose biosynthesis protein BcsQ
MQVIAFVSEMPGSGKTLLAGHIAAQAEAEGLGPVVLLDGDAAGGLSRWWRDRCAATPILGTLDHSFTASGLAQLSRLGVKLVVIDTPSDRSAMREQAVSLANLVVIPTRPIPEDLKAAGTTVEMVESIGTPFVFLINHTRDDAEMPAEAVTALAQYGTVCPVILPRRAGFSQCQRDGRTVMELDPDSPCSEDIGRLWKYLADQLGRAEIRSRVTAVPEAVGVESETLIDLAHDKSKQGRAALVTAITQLYDGQGQGLSTQNREIITDIIIQLIKEVETSVRRSLADQFAERSDVHEDLVIALANDDIEVAHPILLKSEVLRDAELIEIVQYQTMEHQVAIAMRRFVSEQVSDALVETRNDKVVTTLLENAGARISEATMEQLVETSRHKQSYQQPLVQRRDLPARLVRNLYWAVAAVLREHILKNFDFDPDRLDDSIEIAVADATAKDEEEIRRRQAQIEPHGTTNDPDHTLVRILHKGDIGRFLDEFAKFTRLRINTVRQILFEEGGECLAGTCKAAGLDRHTFITIFVHFRHGRLGDSQVEADEVSRAVRSYDQIEMDAARALVLHMKRDPDYLNALRQIGQAAI